MLKGQFYADEALMTRALPTLYYEENALVRVVSKYMSLYTNLTAQKAYLKERQEAVTGILDVRQDRTQSGSPTNERLLNRLRGN